MANRPNVANPTGLERSHEQHDVCSFKCETIEDSSVSSNSRSGQLGESIIASQYATSTYELNSAIARIHASPDPKHHAATVLCKRIRLVINEIVRTPVLEPSVNMWRLDDSAP